uniref:Ig-like domain-containing protein n=1 Tax=Anopheles dirus TaxID=7168 RepID=A0A182NAM5_9DIPT
MNYIEIDDIFSVDSGVEDENMFTMEKLSIPFRQGLSDEAGAKYLMMPSIQSDIEESVPLGERIHLKCTIIVTAGVDLSMKWVFPQSKTFNKTIESNIRSGPLKVMPTRGAEYMFRMSGGLVIDKTIQTDAGTYSCIVEDQNENKKYTDFQLDVQETQENYVLLREENNLSVINVRRNANGITPPIDIVFEYRSYPAIITYYWLNDSGQKIMAGHNGNNDGNSPEIDINKESIILQKGASQDLTCKSNEPIMWVSYNGMYNWVNPIESTEIKLIANPNNLTRTVLSIENVSAKNVGMYYCVNKQSYYKNRHLTLDRLVKMRQASMIHIYVDDPVHPLVAIDGIDRGIEVYRDDYFVSPCKPTLPNVDVEFYRTNGGTQDFVTNCTFDVHGCLLRFDKLEDSGSYFCKAKGKSNQSIHFEVEVIEPSEYLMTPSIQTDIKGPVPRGARILIECKVNITAGVDLSMKWIIPQIQTLYGSVDSNILSGPLKVIPSRGAEHMFTMSGELIIEKAIRANMGSYWCIVEDQNGNKKNSTFKLYARESHEDTVSLREKYNRSKIYVHRRANGETPSIDIVFEYLSNPANITYLWKKNSDIEITAEQDGKYVLGHTDRQIMLRINDLSVYDTGNYSLCVMAGAATNQQQIGVYVYAKPFVQIEQSTVGKIMKIGDKINFTCRAIGFPYPEISFQFRQCKIPQNCSVGDMESSFWHSKFVKTGEQVSFLCRSIGFPRPEITFLFQPCSNKPKWTNCSSQAPAASGWDSPSGTYTNQTKISMSLVMNRTATEPGVVYCRATSSEGSEVAQADLLVSDLPDAITMEIEHPKETITVGDNVTIVCSALVYNYTNDITFARDGIDMIGVWTKYSKTLYAEQARFNIESIQHEDEGMYSCEVKTIYNTYEPRYLRLRVLDPVKPWLISGMSNETLAVELASPLQLQCDVVGTPDPKIIWLKDGITIVPKEGRNRVQLTKMTLTFEFLRKEDLGEYKCRAENKMGSIDKNWKVEVRKVEVPKVECK